MFCPTTRKEELLNFSDGLSGLYQLKIIKKQSNWYTYFLLFALMTVHVHPPPPPPDMKQELEALAMKWLVDTSWKVYYNISNNIYSIYWVKSNKRTNVQEQKHTAWIRYMNPQNKLIKVIAKLVTLKALLKSVFCFTQMNENRAWKEGFTFWNLQWYITKNLQIKTLI